jgi:protein TonB
MSMVRRVGPWLASAALHAALGVAAFLAVAGIGRSPVTQVEDATYTVAIRPGGGPKITEARPTEASQFGTPSNVVMMEDVPLGGVPDLHIKATRYPLPASSQGENTGGRVYEHGPVAKFPATGGGGGSSSKPAAAGLASGVGEGTDVGVEAIPLETPSPAYPEAARRGQVQGTVIAEIRIDRHGKVESARTTSGSGSSLLDDAALAAVRTWSYRPATRGGQPTPSVRRVRFVFKLE